MALCDAIACVFLLSIAPPYGMSILHSYHCSGTCNHLRGRSRFTSCLLSKWLYFIVISDGPLYHNKKRQGTTTAAKFAVYDTIGRASAYFVNDGNCIFWLTTIFLVMLMATKLKTLVCVGVYMILYIIMNLMSYIDGIKYLSPLHYIVVASSNSSQIMFSTILFSIYAICVGILFTHIGIRKIEKMDL